MRKDSPTKFKPNLSFAYILCGAWHCSTGKKGFSKHRRTEDWVIYYLRLVRITLSQKLLLKIKTLWLKEKHVINGATTALGGLGSLYSISTNFLFILILVSSMPMSFYNIRPTCRKTTCRALKRSLSGVDFLVYS